LRVELLVLVLHLVFRWLGSAGRLVGLLLCLPLGLLTLVPLMLMLLLLLPSCPRSPLGDSLGLGLSSLLPLLSPVLLLLPLLLWSPLVLQQLPVGTGPLAGHALGFARWVQRLFLHKFRRRAAQPTGYQHLLP
jgi:hypothetical protein